MIQLSPALSSTERLKSVLECVASLSYDKLGGFRRWTILDYYSAYTSQKTTPSKVRIIVYYLKNFHLISSAFKFYICRCLFSTLRNLVFVPMHFTSGGSSVPKCIQRFSSTGSWNGILHQLLCRECHQTGSTVHGSLSKGSFSTFPCLFYVI